MYILHRLRLPMPWFDLFQLPQWFYSAISVLRQTQRGGADFSTTHKTAELVRMVSWLYLRKMFRHGTGNCIISCVNQQAAISLKECMSAGMGGWWEKCNTVIENTKATDGSSSLVSGWEGLFEGTAVWWMKGSPWLAFCLVWWRSHPISFAIVSSSEPSVFRQCRVLNNWYLHHHHDNPPSTECEHVGHTSVW